MKLVISLFVLGLMTVMHPLWADGGSDGPDPVPDKIIRLIDSEQYDRAAAELKTFVNIEKKNADAWNWLGYSQRSLGDLDASLKSYKKALRIDRKHLGANEYLGELYVMRGEMDKAQKQLSKLAKYCGDCDQFEKLQEVISNAGSG